MSTWWIVDVEEIESLSQSSRRASLSPSLQTYPVFLLFPNAGRTIKQDDWEKKKMDGVSKVSSVVRQCDERGLSWFYSRSVHQATSLWPRRQSVHKHMSERYWETSKSTWRISYHESLFHALCRQNYIGRPAHQRDDGLSIFSPPWRSRNRNRQRRLPIREIVFSCSPLLFLWSDWNPRVSIRSGDSLCSFL